MPPSLAQELLQAADQYMLDGLKRLAEATISSSLSVAHLPHLHELADDYAAPQLGHACSLFALQNYPVSPVEGRVAPSVECKAKQPTVYACWGDTAAASSQLF